jgi:DNA-binding NarL/FixJ family response regulator
MKRDEPIRVLCVDNHPAMRKGIAAILANEPDMLLVGEASNGPDAVELLRLRHPDVTLIDLLMPGLGGIEAIRLMRKEAPLARLVALTSYGGDQDVYRALEAGAWGYLLKEKAHTEIVRAIRTVHSGKRLALAEIAEHLRDGPPHVALTPREVQVLRLVAQGLSNKDISDQLGTMFGTVKIHIQNILCKLRATDRTHAVTIALHRGIIHLEELKTTRNAGAF